MPRHAERPPPLPEGARPAPLPDSLSPQLATLVDRPPAGDDWIWEIKFDGYRLLARLDGGEVRLVTRNGNDWTARMPELAAALRALRIGPAWLDGEIVVQDAHGAPDFNALQNAFDRGRTERIRYHVFDAPYAEGHDLRALPLAARRAWLEQALSAPHDARIAFSEAFAARPEDVLANACRLRLEGVIGKRPDAPYVSRRAPTWIKLKCTHRQEFVVVGYTEPAGARVGLGALLLGFHEPDGRLRYAGKVGTGFDARTLGALRSRLQSLHADATPLPEKPKGVRGQWVRPELVAEVSFAEWTPDGRIRHAVFHGLREDKPAEAVTQETPAPAQAVREAARQETPAKAVREPAAAPASNARPRTTSPVRSPARPTAPPPALPAGLRITHPERVVDEQSGLTKRDIVDWYLRAAPHVLPHLAKRPVALVRAPSGVNGPLVFQKHAETLKIPDLKRLDPALDPGHPPLIEIDSFTALVGAAQFNAVELHTWNATSTRIEQPDRMTFDLDPGEGIAWSSMQEAASLTRALLEELGLESFLKTSGGKGLHVVVPIAPRHGWDTVKAVSHAVVRRLAAASPDRFVARSGAKHRVGRIFVDDLRNRRGATTAAAFSVRARPGLGVSIPCDWSELPRLTGGDHWRLPDAAERLERGADPWGGYRSCARQSIAAAMKALGVAAP